MKMSKQYIILLILILMMVGSVTALGADESWTEYQNDNDNNGRYNFVGTNLIAGIEQTLTVGSNQSVLDADMDFDGSTNFMMLSLNYFYILDSTLTSVEYARNNLMPPQTTAGIIINAPFSRHVFVVNNSFVETHWTGTVYNTTVRNTPELSSCTGWDGLKCSQSSQNCYAVCGNSTNVRMVTFTINGNITVGPALAGKVDGTHTGTLGNIDNIDGLDYVFVSDRDLDNQYGISVISVDTGTYNNYFNTNGSLDDLSGNVVTVPTDNYIHNPLLYNVDGLGDQEILVGYAARETGTCGVNSDVYHLRMVRAVGSTLWVRNQDLNIPTSIFFCDGTAGNKYQKSQPILALRNNTPQVCTSRNGNAGFPAPSLIGCVSALSGANTGNLSIGSFFGTIQGQFQYSGAAIKNVAPNNLGFETDDLLFGKYVVNVTPAGIYTEKTNYTNIGNDYYFSVTDSVGDGTADIIATSNSVQLTYIEFTQGSGAGTGNDNAQYNDNLTKGGLTGYYNGAVCTGTNITFQGNQCPNAGGCAYTNDRADDVERLVANCGNGDTITGAFASASVAVTCAYPAAGTFNAYVYLQDQTHQSDLTESQIFTINVINGIPGQTCNIASTFVGNPTQNTETDGDADSVITSGFTQLWTMLFGTSKLAWFIAGFVFFMMAVLAGYFLPFAAAALMGTHAQGGSTFMSVFMGICLIVFNVLTLLWSPWLIILPMIIAALVILLYYILSKGG